MELKSGTYLQGDKYRIERSLGQGGFGITYLAEHELAGRMVCIKEFFPKSFYNRDADSSHVSLGSQGSAEMMDAYKQKFLKEARTIARLDHQNIIHIHDVFQENGTAYYVMEYIEGESLQDIVRRRGALPTEEALALMNPVIDAVGYIHDNRIMHLDIKPGNIMVREKDGRPILIDFGLSKQYDEEGNQTSSTPVGISHGFAPIEQYQMGGVSAFSPQTDIYSLGATLYYLVSGTVPPQAAIVANEGMPELPATISTNVRTAIEKAMEFRSKQRPESIAKLKQLLGSNATATVSVPTSAQPSANTVIDIVADNSSTQIDGGATQIDVQKDDATQIDAPEDDATQIDGGSETAIEPKSQPEPKVAPKPAPKVAPKPEPKSVSASKPTEPKKKSKWWLWLLLIIVGVVIGVVFMRTDSQQKASVPEPRLHIMSCSSGTIEFTGGNGEIHYILENTYDHTGVYSNYDVDWLNTSVSDGVISYTVDANSSYEQRSAVITISYYNSQHVKVLITQDGKPTTTYGPYEIGDYYIENGVEGVVFEVSDGGLHGKIVSMNQISDVMWDTRVYLYDDAEFGLVHENGTNTSADDLSNGKANTDAIMRRWDSAYFPAFTWCRNIGSNWYLPAVEELLTISRNVNEINTTLSACGGVQLNSWYWSSTENQEMWLSDTYALDVSMGASNHGSDPKNSPINVRAVTTF